jgi:16S rRNA (guanine(966)-N(2))-methyltransferase RsmD
MRVISGKWKGRKLILPKDLSFRPTLDQIKESLFSIIGPDINFSVFVDCFAGTGSVGIEALSRNAKKVYFMETNRERLSVIRENLKMLGARPDSYEIIETGAVSGVVELGELGEKADYFFIDPPYKENELAEEVLYYIDWYDLLKPGGMAIAQAFHKVYLRGSFGKLRIKKRYAYGTTILLKYQYEEET